MSRTRADPEIVIGQVISVQDGDSFDLQTADGHRMRIRIAAIDAPELGQPYGRQSSDQLRKWLDGKNVQVSLLKTDRYGRRVANVAKNGRDIGLALIAAGLAWHYGRYAHEQPLAQRARYSEAEALARRRGRGVWQDTAPTPPWQFRQQRRPY